MTATNPGGRMAEALALAHQTAEMLARHRPQAPAEGLQPANTAAAPFGMAPRADTDPSNNWSLEPPGEPGEPQWLPHARTGHEPPPTVAEPEPKPKAPRKPRQRRPRGTDEAGLELFGAVKLASLAEPALRGRFRWCAELGWLAHDGTKWAPEAGPLVLRAVVEVIKTYTLSILERQAALTQDDCRELAGFSTGSTQNHALKILQGAEGVLTDWREFDAPPAVALGEPWTLPCANGVTVELYSDGTKKVRPTTPDDMNTKTACAYDPDAKAPGIAAAFKSYQPDDNVRRYQMQMWCRALSGLGAENFIAGIGVGGGNGKGTMASLVAAAGGGYAANLPVQVILKGQHAAREVYRSELAKLRACRYVFTEEPDEGAVYDLGMLKALTGGGDISGRAMKKDEVTFRARWLFEMAANKRPGWKADKAMTRRYVEIAWNFSIEGTIAGIQEDFKEKLAAEASGFLNAILHQWTGAAKPVIPDVIAQQTRMGAAEASPLAGFVAEALVRTSGAKARAQALFDVYKKWAHEAGITMPMKRPAFGSEMERLGYPKDTDEKGTFYANALVNEEYDVALFGH